MNQSENRWRQAVLLQEFNQKAFPEKHRFEQKLPAEFGINVVSVLASCIVPRFFVVKNYD
jgi:hypothetical protein